MIKLSWVWHWLNASTPTKSHSVVVLCYSWAEEGERTVKKKEFMSWSKECEENTLMAKQDQKLNRHKEKKLLRKLNDN